MIIIGLENVAIDVLLNTVENGETKLPDIQREFVWTNTQVKDLIDSLYRKHPVGLLLRWEAPIDKDVPTKSIDENNNNKNFRYLVIDGQQRLTSLLLVKKGILKKGNRTIEIKVYFNPFTEEFQLESPKIRNKPDWFRVTEIMEKSVYNVVDIPKLKNEMNLNDEKLQVIMKKLGHIENLYKETLPVYNLPSKIDYEEIADIFVKVNSKGTRIRITELLLALLAIKIPGEFKKGLYDYLNELSGNDWDIDVSVLIRSLVGIAIRQGRLSSFKKIAKDISEKDLKEYWKRTKENMDHVIQILDQNLGIRTSSFLPSESVLVPMIVYLDNKKSRLTDRETRHLILWFLLASFWGRYTGPTETRLDTDIKDAVKQDPFKQMLKNVRDQVGRLKIENVEDFEGRGKDKRLLLYIVARELGASDWFRGHRITTTDIQEHHIFPRSLLKKMDIETRLIDDISNIAFLTEKANKIISNKEPSVYVKEQKIDEEKLRNQFIPLDKDLLEMSNFEMFLVERRKLIVNAINKYFDKIGIGELL